MSNTVSFGREDRAQLEIVLPEAWDYYTKANASRGAFQFYLRRDFLGELVNTIQRPVTLEELKLLVCDDGPEVQCALCPRTFQPVKWLNVGDPTFVQELLDGRPLLETIQLAVENDIRIFGSYYYDPETHEKPVAVCGTVWCYLKDRQMYMPRHGSCLVRAWEATSPDTRKRFWGLCCEDQMMVYNRVQEKKRREKKDAEETNRRVEEQQRRALEEVELTKRRNAERQLRDEERAKSELEANQLAKSLFGGCGKGSRPRR